MVLLVASMTLALVATGCGVEGNDAAAPAITTQPDGSPSTPPGAPGATTTPQDTVRSTTTRDSTSGGSNIPSTSDGSSGGNGTIPGGINIHDGLVQGFKSAGLTNQQAECMADGYEKLGITDPESSADFDYTKILGLFDDCGVSLSDLGGQFPGDGGTGGN